MRRPPESALQRSDSSHIDQLLCFLALWLSDDGSILDIDQL
jgi:hypothetical protein